MKQGSTAMRRGWRARAGIGLPVLLIALALQGPALARPHVHKPAAVPHREQIPSRILAGLSQDRVIAIAEKRYQAKVVRTEETTVKGRRAYVLRLLSKEGKVWTVKVDAETGTEL